MNELGQRIKVKKIPMSHDDLCRVGQQYEILEVVGDFSVKHNWPFIKEPVKFRVGKLTIDVFLNKLRKIGVSVEIVEDQKNKEGEDGDSKQG